MVIVEAVVVVALHEVEEVLEAVAVEAEVSDFLAEWVLCALWAAEPEEEEAMGEEWTYGLTLRRWIRRRLWRR